MIFQYSVIFPFPCTLYTYIYIYIWTGLITVTVARKKAPFIARKKSLKIDFPCQTVRHFYLLQYLTVAQSPYGLAEPWIDWIDMSVQQLSLVRLMWRHAVNAITHFFPLWLPDHKSLQATCHLSRYQDTTDNRHNGTVSLACRELKRQWSMVSLTWHALHPMDMNTTHCVLMDWPGPANLSGQ